MNGTINFALQFLAAVSPGPEPGPEPTPTPTPTPGGGGGGGTSAVAQTGDFNVFMFLLVLFVALAAILTLFMAVKAKSQGTNMRSVAVNYAFSFATNTRLAIIGALVVAAIALLCGLTITSAFADHNEDPANDTIKVYVNEETGQITSIDTATYTNQTGQNIAIADLASAINQEAQGIEGLDRATMTVTSNGQIFYQGKIGSPYTPSSTIFVNAGESLTLSFDFKDLAATVSQELIGKNAINLSFSEKTYNTITYNANGGTGTLPSPQTKIEDETATIAAGSGLVKGEDKFASWNTSADGTGSTYQAGDSYATNADLTLFAQYTSTKNITLTYQIVAEYKDKNHGDVKLNSDGDAA